MVKNLPAMWETRVQSLGWKDPLEKGMDSHSSILAWRILWTEEPGRLQSIALQCEVEVFPAVCVYRKELLEIPNSCRF